MVIKRTIDGEERIFVLTSMELFNAYSEQEHIWDVDYVESQLENGLFEEIEDICFDEADRAEIAEEIASEMRRQINKYACLRSTLSQKPFTRSEIGARAANRSQFRSLPPTVSTKRSSRTTSTLSSARNNPA